MYIALLFMFCLIKSDLLTSVNTYRVFNGLQPLKSDPHLDLAAQYQAYIMCNSDTLTHNSQFPSLISKLEFFKFTAKVVGENIARQLGNDPGEIAQVWFRSNEHRKNVLGNYTVAGVGTCRNSKNRYWVQIFGLIDSYKSNREAMKVDDYEDLKVSSNTDAYSLSDNLRDIDNRDRLVDFIKKIYNNDTDNEQKLAGNTEYPNSKTEKEGKRRTEGTMYSNDEEGASRNTHKEQRGVLLPRNKHNEDLQASSYKQYQDVNSNDPLTNSGEILDAIKKFIKKRGASKTKAKTSDKPLIMNIIKDDNTKGDNFGLMPKWITTIPSRDLSYGVHQRGILNDDVIRQSNQKIGIHGDLGVRYKSDGTPAENSSSQQNEKHNRGDGLNYRDKEGKNKESKNSGGRDDEDYALSAVNKKPFDATDGASYLIPKTIYSVIYISPSDMNASLHSTTSRDKTKRLPRTVSKSDATSSQPFLSIVRASDQAQQSKASKNNDYSASSSKTGSFTAFQANSTAIMQSNDKAVISSHSNTHSPKTVTVVKTSHIISTVTESVNSSLSTDNSASIVSPSVKLSTIPLSENFNVYPSDITKTVTLHHTMISAETKSITLTVTKEYSVKPTISEAELYDSTCNSALVSTSTYRMDSGPAMSNYIPSNVSRISPHYAEQDVDKSLPCSKNKKLPVNRNRDSTMNKDNGPALSECQKSVIGQANNAGDEQSTSQRQPEIESGIDKASINSLASVIVSLIDSRLSKWKSLPTTQATNLTAGNVFSSTLSRLTVTETIQPSLSSMSFLSTTTIFRTKFPSISRSPVSSDEKSDHANKLSELPPESSVLSSASTANNSTSVRYQTSSIIFNTTSTVYVTSTVKKSSDKTNDATEAKKEDDGTKSLTKMNSPIYVNKILDSTVSYKDSSKSILLSGEVSAVSSTIYKTLAPTVSIVQPDISSIISSVVEAIADELLNKREEDAQNDNYSEIMHRSPYEHQGLEDYDDKNSLPLVKQEKDGRRNYSNEAWHTANLNLGLDGIPNPTSNSLFDRKFKVPNYDNVTPGRKYNDRSSLFDKVMYEIGKRHQKSLDQEGDSRLDDKFSNRKLKNLSQNNYRYTPRGQSMENSYNLSSVEGRHSIRDELSDPKESKYQNMKDRDTKFDQYGRLGSQAISNIDMLNVNDNLRKKDSGTQPWNNEDRSQRDKKLSNENTASLDSEHKCNTTDENTEMVQSRDMRIDLMSSKSVLARLIEPIVKKYIGDRFMNNFDYDKSRQVFGDQLGRKMGESKRGNT